MSSEHREIPGDAGREALCDAADLADAPGRALSAGVSRHPGDDAFVPRFLLHPGPAGRLLRDYRAIRATTRSFLDFCYTPDKAVEVTLQPVRRFGLDAAIIFSDILVVPDALGQKVWFEEGEGPKLEALTDPADFGKLTRARPPEKLAPVYEAIRRTRAELPKETALLGFAG